MGNRNNLPFWGIPHLTKSTWLLKDSITLLPEVCKTGPPPSTTGVSEKERKSKPTFHKRSLRSNSSSTVLHAIARPRLHCHPTVAQITQSISWASGQTPQYQDLQCSELPNSLNWQFLNIRYRSRKYTAHCCIIGKRSHSYITPPQNTPMQDVIRYGADLPLVLFIAVHLYSVWSHRLALSS